MKPDYREWLTFHDKVAQVARKALGCRVRLPDFDAMYKDMAAALPGSVTCTQCGRKQTVNPEYCLRHGWPKCHGQTMSLDRPSQSDGEVNG